MHRGLLVFALLFVLQVTLCQQQQYSAPEISENVYFFDNFNSDPFQNGWTPSSHTEKYNGQWTWSTPKNVKGIETDRGLMTGDKAKHYGIIRKFDQPIETKDKDLVLQYEVKYDQKLTCSGSYVKLIYHNDLDQANIANFHDKQKNLMFGPDYCGATDKVHFIFNHQNPITKQWEEKHLKNPPTVQNDQLTHVYTLIMRKDNSFEILIDGKSARKGSLLQDFEPPVNPPKTIDDPEDKKPEDWVDEEYMDDPEAVKPDDWDESQPEEIPDPEDKKPEGWLDDEPLSIPDPEAKQPDNWDEEEDGQWEAPMVPNPKCESVGCGTFKPRFIKNPAYRGKWYPPKIKNPAYQGEWHPRQIENPDFFEDKDPHVLPPLGALGIDIWTMDENILFDNFVVTDREDVALSYLSETWKIKNEKEKEALPVEDKPNTLITLLGQVPKYLLVIVGLTGVGFPLICYWAFSRGSGKSEDEHVETQHAELQETNLDDDSDEDEGLPETNLDDDEDEEDELQQEEPQPTDEAQTLEESAGVKKRKRTRKVM